VTSQPGQERHTREILARSRAGDWDKFMLTACYAADRCQGDLGCPFSGTCSRWSGCPDDDEYDD